MNSTIEKTESISTGVAVTAAGSAVALVGISVVLNSVLGQFLGVLMEFF